MLLVGSSKFERYNNHGIGGRGGGVTDSEYEQGGTTTGHEDDSGNEDDEDLERSEEIVLPEGEEDDEDPEFDLAPSPLQEDDEDILYRQLAYPPLPEYIPPYQSFENLRSSNPKKSVSKKKESRRHARERLGVLTPMEEVTEPSSAGTEASGLHPRSRDRKKTDRLKKQRQGDKKPVVTSPSRVQNSVSGQQHDSDDLQKSILKSKSPLSSPDRRVKFVGAGSATQSERSVSPTESQTSEYSSIAGLPRKEKNATGNNGMGHDDVIQEVEDENDVGNSNGEDGIGGGQPEIGVVSESLKEDDKNTSSDPLIDQLNKVETWQLGSDNDSQDATMANIDAEFPSILDDIIAELHSWDRLAGTGASVTEVGLWILASHYLNKQYFRIEILD